MHCLRHIDTVIKEETAGRVAGIVLEPIQGWAGSTVPPEGFMQGLRQFCTERGILLFVDAVLLDESVLLETLVLVEVLSADAMGGGGIMPPPIIPPTPPAAAYIDC